MTLIRLHRVYYPVTALGPGKRLGIWVQGCTRACPDCLSPEMQPLSGTPVPVETVLQHMPADIHPDGMTVSGGEPFDQPAAVAEMMQWFIRHYSADVLVYTGYTLAELQARHDPATDAILSSLAALVDGPYQRQQNYGRGWMGSENQRLYVYRFPERYRHFTTARRTLQAVQQAQRLLFIGIPPRREETPEEKGENQDADIRGRNTSGRKLLR